MPTQPCSIFDKKIAQTLFLGASVANFNTSLGWGDQSSQLTVNLIEDKASGFCNDVGAPLFSQFPNSRSVNPNHYHDCVGDDCYMLADGSPFDSSKHDYTNRQLLGKVFYQFYDNPPVTPLTGKTNAVLSQYWTLPDPGFMGSETAINLDGTTLPNYDPSAGSLNAGYDIINCPVYFRVGDFSFGGLVQSWSVSQSNSGETITVNIEDLKSLLSECYIILGKFSGAVFSKAKTTGDNFYGKPHNWVGDDVDYLGRLYNGNIPNVFNVYGFLESFGVGSFGAANLNQNGISVNKVVDALSVLTGNVDTASSIFNPAQAGFAQKSAFSPFGRILAKTPQTYSTYRNITSGFGRFGIVPPTASLADGVDRSEFVLDLSEIPRLPDDFRIAEPVMSITDLITRISDEAGFDFLIDYNPITYNSKITNVIKVKVVSRNSQPVPNQISNTVKRLACDGFQISSNTIGKEKNNTNLKSVIIGGNQKRLLQIKSNRLAYTQAHLVFNSTTQEFVNYDTLGNDFGIKSKFHHGKYRFPSAFSTNNIGLSKQVNPNQSTRYDAEDAFTDAVTGADEGDADTIYNDAMLGGAEPNPTQGNYWKSVNIDQRDPISVNNPGSAEEFAVGNQFRWFPLFKDAICPFFGYIREEELKVDTEDKNTDFRIPRPVYLDTWTGQLAVIIRLFELPEISVSLSANIVLDGEPCIIISESEIRSALVGFDNFLCYSLAKQYRPDLLEAVRLSHKAYYYDKLIAEGTNPSEAVAMANKKYDWFWRQIHGNIAGPDGQPIELAPAKNDGSAYVDEKALQDLQILHQFINTIAGYYGKQYMVSLPNLHSYRDQQFADITLPSNYGDVVVFQGGGELFYNYEPTDAAWEEPGNALDNTISIGGDSYYALAEKDGKIGPVLGYNSNKYFDYTKKEMCRFAQSVFNQNRADLSDQKINPAWSYDIFDELLTMKDQQCPDNGFIFNSINLASLPATDYINVSAGGSARDAFNKTMSGTPLNKCYLKAQANPQITYLDPKSFYFPKAIVSSPGLTLNTSSSQYNKDPNRTVITNVSIEDLIIYLKTTNPRYWDYEFIGYQLYYVSPAFRNQFYGNFAVSSNESATHVEIAPKAAHPFFAAIPIELKNYVYGPWANNVYLDYLNDPQQVFPDGVTVKTGDGFPPTCTEEPATVNDAQAKNIIDNFIGPMNVEVDEELVPWNFGGAGFMDKVANLKAYSKLNYQNIIETAQIKMPGIPIFDLGSSFDTTTFNNAKVDFGAYIGNEEYNYTDVKLVGNSHLSDDFRDKEIPNTLSLPYSFGEGVSPNTENYRYTTIALGTPKASPSTVISNIQVNVGNGAVETTYSLRTYTKKLSLFNKTAIDRATKEGRERISRNKQLASISQQNNNSLIQQFKTREDQRINNANKNFDSIGFSSKLFGWSPTSVLIGQASPYLKSLNTFPDYIPPSSEYVLPDEFGSLGSETKRFTLPKGEDIGDNIDTKSTNLLQDTNAHIPTLMNVSKIRTDVAMYDIKEVRTQLNSDYGLQSAMSLDGLLSPVSFYPTYKHSTFSYSKYDIDSCPFCKGTKKIKTEYKYYMNGYQQKIVDFIYCDYCARRDENLKYKLTESASSSSSEILPPYIITNETSQSVLELFQGLTSGGGSSSSTAGDKPSINLTTLNPILVGDGDFRNTNTQNYAGEHPDGKHEELRLGNNIRQFRDRSRHSIEIVARGAIVQRDLEITSSQYEYQYDRDHHPDYHSRDLELNNSVSAAGAIPTLEDYQMNQRFLGLRGPLVMHAWGYDKDGFPIPNAADEPLEIDALGRPRRFKLKVKESYPKTVVYSELANGSAYAFAVNGELNVKGEEKKPPDDKTEVQHYVYENDLSDAGGFMDGDMVGSNRLSGFQGDIISKTQAFTNGKWSEKTKLKEFYLNFGERPDLWPVGPIDLRWDYDRHVWTVPVDVTVYKMVYVTLEENLIKAADYYDETLPARGFLDEIEYRQEPLPNNARRLVYVRDKSGYTAPRGAKLLCRYDTSSGYYEPVSKPSFSAYGALLDNNQAVIDMDFAQGKVAGSVPTMQVKYDNKFNTTFGAGAKGFFNFNGGKWILINAG